MIDRQTSLLILSGSIIIVAILVFTSWRSMSVSNHNRELDRQQMELDRELAREKMEREDAIAREKLEIERERFLIEQEKQRRARELPES